MKSAYAADYSGRFTIDMNRNVTTCTDGPTVTATTAQFTSTNHIFLFAYNTNGSPQNRATGVRLYSCKIYENDELVRDFRAVPGPGRRSVLVRQSYKDVFLECRDRVLHSGVTR